MLDPEYDQRRWCLCIYHHACIDAGITPREGGPIREDIPDTPRGRTVYSMMDWLHEDTALLLPHIGDDGVIRVPPGGVGKFGGGAVIHGSVWIDKYAVIGKYAWLDKCSTIGERAVIGRGATIGRRAVIGDHVIIDADSIVSKDTVVGNQQMSDGILKPRPTAYGEGIEKVGISYGTCLPIVIDEYNMYDTKSARQLAANILSACEAFEQYATPDDIKEMEIEL